MQNRQLVSRFACAALVAAIGLFNSTARAGTIEIAFTGMNLVYDGSSLYDAGSNAGGLADPADADPLTSVDVFVDGSLVGSLSSDISADIFIPDVTGIPAAPSTTYGLTTPGNPGFFDLLVGTSPLASEFLLLDLSEVSVTYIDVLGQLQFTFAAAVADSNAQNLPFALEIGDPVTLSFSARLNPATKTTAGGFVTGFAAAGTGEIGGQLIPEPSSAMLFAIGALALPLITRRRRGRST
jgi:hypothetical protein